VALLQTHLHIESNSAGQWHVLVDKPTTSDEILKALVPRMLALPAGK
jgi:hypothetical protein